MSEATRSKSLAEVVLESGLCTAEQIAIARKREGLDLISALVADGAAAEDRLIRSLSGSLGLEIVALEGLQVHERVLSLIPAELALRHWALPIAMKRSGETDFLYLSMADPLDQSARAELQKAAGCQLVVVLAAPSQLRAEVERFYAARSKKPKGSNRIPANLPSESPPPLPRRELAGAQEPGPGVRAAARALSSPGSAAAHLRSGEQWEVNPDAPKQIHLYDHRTGDIVGRTDPARASHGPATPTPLMSGSASPLPLVVPSMDPRDDLREAIIRSGEHPRVSTGPMPGESPTERPAAPPSKSGPGTPRAAAPKLPAFRLDNLPSVPGQGDFASRFSPTPGMTEPTMKLSSPALPAGVATIQEVDVAATVLDMPIASAMGLPTIEEADISIDDVETTAEEGDAIPSDTMSADAVAHALELPVRISDAPSPFDDLRDVRHRPGLEKTGVIPLAELMRDEFNPRQLDAAPAENLLGSRDIPESSAEARARAVPLVSEAPPEFQPPPAPRLRAPSVPGGAARMAAQSASSASQEKPARRVISELQVGAFEAEPTRRVSSPPKRPELPRVDSQPVFQSLLEAEPPSTERGAAHKKKTAPLPASEPRAAPASAVPPTAEAGSYEEAMVQRLMGGESLTSADRARLVLAVGRLLLQRGILSKQELVAILRDAR